MWLTHFWHSWSQFFIFAWDVTAGGILRTGVLICLVDYVPIILSSWNFQELLPVTKVRSMQKVKVKVTEVTTQLNRFRTVTPVWIHIWWWDDAYSLIMLRKGALLFLAATKQLYEWYFLSVCLSVCPSVTPFYTPVWKTERIMPSQCPSVRLSVRPSVRPRFPDFSSTCFEISIWNLVYAFSRWHDMSSLSCITIGSIWPSLQPKVGQTYFLQSWPHKSR